MTTAIVLTAIVGIPLWLALGLLAGRAARRRRQPWLARLERPQILVHTVDDQSISGAIVTVAPDGLVLCGARILEGDGVTPMAGDVWLPRARIRYVQVPTAELVAGSPRLWGADPGAAA